jgi:hypothetical protein
MAAVNMIWGWPFPSPNQHLTTFHRLPFAFWRFVIALSNPAAIIVSPGLTFVASERNQMLLLMGALGFGITQITQPMSLALQPCHAHCALYGGHTTLVGGIFGVLGGSMSRLHGGCWQGTVNCLGRGW